MSTTDTTDLQSALSAKRADIDGGQPAVDSEYIPPAGPGGEIVSAPQQGDSPPSPTPGTASPGTAVAPAQPVEVPIPFPEIPPKVIGGLPYAAQYAKLARTISQTEMVPGAMRGRWDAVTACFMRGYEMGLGPMQALDSFHVIDGKVGLTAEAMRALIIQDGHQIRLSDLYEGNEFVGTAAKCRRKEWPEGEWEEYRFTMADANQAGLNRASRSGKPSNWQTYPRAMCDARATSGAGRRYFPDVLAGMSYTPEEIRDFDGPGEAQEVDPSQSANGTTAAPPTATAGPLESALQQEQPSGPSSSPPPPPPADAPEASSATAPASAPPAESTAPASATSPEGTGEPAQPTASTSTKKNAGKSKSAAKKAAPAPPAPSPAAATPAAAPGSSVPKAPDAGGSPPTATAPGPTSSPAPASAPSSADDDAANGGGGVLRAMASGLVQIINGLPREQQAICRAFIRQHYPDGIDSITDMGEMQAAIDIATGWPGSADTHPIPLRGEEVWAGFTTRVILSEGEYLTNCTLCVWALEEAATNTNLPEFRRLELAKQACQTHEQGQYEDGTPFCPGKPSQGTLPVE